MKGLEIGEGGVYVTTGEKPGDLLEDAQSFGFGLASGIDQKKIVILDYSSHFDQIRENGGEIDVRKIVRDLNKYIKQINARRLVIDPIVPSLSRRRKCGRLEATFVSLFYALDCHQRPSIIRNS